MLRWASGCGFRLLINSGLQRAASSVAPTIVLDKSLEEGNTKSETPKLHKSSVDNTSVDENIIRGTKVLQSRLVSAAFESLKSGAFKRKRVGGESNIEEAIRSASSPEQLLALEDDPNMSRQYAVQIVAVLAEWSMRGHADERSYEGDPRFVALCQRLKNHKGSGDSGGRDDGLGTRDLTRRKQSQGSGTEGGGDSGNPAGRPPTDLSMVLGVTGDDEAARLISTISLEQMIKVLSSLAAKKRRSIQLLRSLSYNVSSTNLKLNVKQCADILYSLATLNYPDEVLLNRVCSDLKECITECQKTAVIGSIATSLGFLRYKDTVLMDLLCDWFIQNKRLCRNQDLSSLLYTFAIVDHRPLTDSFMQAVSPLLKEEEFQNAVSWLDVVWSLVVLRLANSSHYQSVLSPAFIERLSTTNFTGGSLSVSCKRKLLNINGSALWLNGYNGPLLSENAEVRNLPLVRSKGKQALVVSVIDSLSNLFTSSTNFLKVNVNSGMGFLIDGECFLDSKMTPLPLVDTKVSGSSATNSAKKGTRIAVMVWDYHDFTRRESSLTGPCLLNEQLTSSAGYRIVSVPYSEFCSSQKLTTWVQYLEKRLRSIVQRPPDG